jgi:hypothetical protein
MSHQDTIQRIRLNHQEEKERIAAQLTSFQLQIAQARGPARGLLVFQCKNMEEELRTLENRDRIMRMETHFNQLNTDMQMRGSMREREILMSNLTGETCAPDAEKLCSCGVDTVCGDYGEIMCPTCGAMWRTVDEKVESMVEPSFYHYKHERYAQVVLNRITGETTTSNGERTAVPEHVIAAVVHELVNVQGIRDKMTVTVGQVGKILNACTTTVTAGRGAQAGTHPPSAALDVAEKTIRLRKYLKDRTEIWGRCVNRPAPVLVPRVSREVIKLFASVVNRGNLEENHNLTASEKEREEQRQNFQGYQFYLRAAIQTYIFMLEQNDGNKMDISSLARLGGLDVFMEDVAVDTSAVHARNARYEKAWVSSINALFPEIGFTRHNLVWPHSKKRKR